MRRDKDLALRILEIVEDSDDKFGMPLSLLVGALPGRHQPWTDAMTYNLDLLVRSDFLTKTAATGTEPSWIQLTWKGHDLLEELLG